MSGPPQSRYRVFLSYSHSDEAIVHGLEEVLTNRGLVPMRDKHFAYGVGFHGQIQRFIEHAHVFVPVITEQSIRRGWVQQEIGYAMAQNVPVLPIAIASTPGEWLQSLHAVVLEAPQSQTPKAIEAALRPLEAILRPQPGNRPPRLIEKLIRDYSEESHARYACAYLQEDRTAAITRYAQDVYAIQVSYPGLPLEAAPGVAPPREFALSSFVRQKGGLSSFHIPDAPLSAPTWKRRYGQQAKSEHHGRLQRGERRVLELHAAEWGARIIINPWFRFEAYGAEARRDRLESLLGVLTSDRIPGLEVAFHRHMSFSETTTILGSWFLAQAISAAAPQGYYQTILTRHAPSMQTRIEAFDEEFEGLLDSQGWTAENSRSRAVSAIRRLLRTT